MGKQELIRSLRQEGFAEEIISAFDKVPREKFISAQFKDYAYEVRTRKFPSDENFYEIKEEELEKLLADPKWKYVAQEAKNQRPSV